MLSTQAYVLIVKAHRCTRIDSHARMLITSTSWCQCSIGLRGLASMAAQCSLPGPSASLPTRHIPITSLWPMLIRSKGRRSGSEDGREREREKQAVRKGNGWREGLEKQKEGDRACKKQPQSLIYQPWVLGKEYSGWGRKLNSSSQIHTALYKTSVSEEAGMSTNIQKHTPIEMPNGGQAT